MVNESSLLLQSSRRRSSLVVPSLLVLGCFAAAAFVATSPELLKSTVQHKSHKAEKAEHLEKGEKKTEKKSEHKAAHVENAAKVLMAPGMLQKHYTFEDEVQRVGELSPQLRSIVDKLSSTDLEITAKEDKVLMQAIESRMTALLAIKADVDELDAEKQHHHKGLEEAKTAFKTASSPMEKVKAALQFYSPKLNQFSNTDGHTQDHNKKLEVIAKIKELRKIKRKIEDGEEVSKDALDLDLDEEELKADEVDDNDIISAAPVIGQTLKRVTQLKNNLVAMKSGTELEKAGAKVHFLFDVLTMRANSDHNLHVVVKKSMDSAVHKFQGLLHEAEAGGKILTDAERQTWHEALWQVSLLEHGKDGAVAQMRASLPIVAAAGNSSVAAAPVAATAPVTAAAPTAPLTPTAEVISTEASAAVASEQELVEAAVVETGSNTTSNSTF